MQIHAHGDEVTMQKKVKEGLKSLPLTSLLQKTAGANLQTFCKITPAVD